MRITLIQTGKTTSGYVSEGIGDFSSRIKKYTGFDIITVPDIKNTRNMPPDEQKTREGRAIARMITNEDYVVALDESGKSFSTMEFAGLLEKLFLKSVKRLVFIIGGPWGLSGEITERADLKMSLSKLTFPHQLVRLLFTEQLYRVLTVINGDPYHHQ
jgi:23S rRNA (pseudouridine1915-N3)-methyltransferase